MNNKQNTCIHARGQGVASATENKKQFNFPELPVESAIFREWWGECIQLAIKQPGTILYDMFSTTFVSAYFPLTQTPYFTDAHPEQWTPDTLLDFVSLGVPFCLYLGKECPQEPLFRQWESLYPRFRVMSYRADYLDTWVHSQCQTRADGTPRIPPAGLPANRNREKDTYEYLVYMNARVEWMEDAISENIWETSHFAWVDFNLSTLFRQKKATLAFLSGLARTPLASSFLAIPGCWSKPGTSEKLATDIHWRFCGGFFLGDADSLCEFAATFRAHFPAFLDRFHCIPWEVNFWAYLEIEHDWSPDWYKGDHNDTIVYVSADAYTRPLPSHMGDRIEYDYPVVPGFYAGSASYAFHRGRHWLNTRYVSYWMYPNGYYRFGNSERVIENRNWVSELDGDTLCPLSYAEMGSVFTVEGGAMLPPTEKRPFSEGLEDIRLYSMGDRLRFIATTVNYSPSGKSRMMVGTYVLPEDGSREGGEFRECIVVEPPTDSWCEKNWIPLISPGGDDGAPAYEEWFVYKWCPMELGRIDSGNTLRIERRWATPGEIFSKIRGSTTFCEYDESHLVGVVHFSEEHTPRHYYHRMVLLEKTTFRPMKISPTFFFEKLSIEFCIGMTRKEGMFHFWISRFDRDPVRISIPQSEIVFSEWTGE